MLRDQAGIEPSPNFRTERTCNVEVPDEQAAADRLVQLGALRYSVAKGLEHADTASLVREGPMRRLSVSLVAAIALVLTCAASAQASVAWSARLNGHSHFFLPGGPGIAQMQEVYAYAKDSAGSKRRYPSCGSGVSDSHVVATYTMKRIQGGYRDSVLYCGKSSYGFRHIEAADNGKRISNYPGGWPGFDYSIAATLKTWTSYKYSSSNDTYAHYKRIDECNGSTWVASWMFNVVTARVSAKIITAYRSSSVKQESGQCPSG